MREDHSPECPSASIQQCRDLAWMYYHAGPLFTQGDLLANLPLSRAISTHSGNKFVPLLPQDLEQRGETITPHSIRDKDIRALLSCELALFTYDGSELDSGTVVEFMIAKFADIPSVILRSDFRGGGDQGTGSHPAGVAEPWNLMSSFYPRTRSVVADGMKVYKEGLALAAFGEGVDVSKSAGEAVIEVTAQRYVEMMEEVVKLPARMPRKCRVGVYEWLGLMPGYAEGQDGEDRKKMRSLLLEKERKGMFGKESQAVVDL